jgi:hypothetical protein
MLDDQSQHVVNGVSRTARIIVLALCGGIVAFGVFALFYRDADQEESAGILTYMSIGFAVLETIMCLIVPRFIVGANRRRIASGTWSLQGNQVLNVDTDVGKLAVTYQQATIIGCAFLEGAAFLALTAYLTEGHVAALIAAAAMLIGVALHMPLGDGVSSWVERQLQIIDEEKQFSSSA